MTKAELENGIRQEIMAKIRDLLAQEYDTDVYQISASEIVIPVLDAERNEKWACVRISIPRGSRNGEGGYTPYDGNAAAEEYKLEQAEKAAKKAAAEEKKRVKMAADQRKREEARKKKEAEAAAEG